MNNKTKSNSIPIYDKVASTTLLDGDYITCIGSANFWLYISTWLALSDGDIKPSSFGNLAWGRDS